VRHRGLATAEDSVDIEGRRRRFWPVPFVIVVAAFAVACGKKGPPLPPLVKVPVAPVDFTAERRGTEIRIQFTVPSTNTDGSKPANVARVEVYRFTGPNDTTDQQLLKLGTRVATVPVKAPRNPDVTTDEDEPPEEPELEDEGLDQGSVAQFEDELGPALSSPQEAAKPRRATNGEAGAGPLVGVPASAPATIYAAVGLNKRGRKGPLSKRIAVPLVPPPRTPSPPTISYDETAIHVVWPPAVSTASAQGPRAEDELASRVIGFSLPTVGYHLYDVSPSSAPVGGPTPKSAAAGQQRLTQTPLTEPRYDDSSIEWGATRCYTVRTVETIGGLSLESEAPPPQCQTLVDTFPPSAPKDLQLVAGERSINLIWAPNSEKDVAGYIVLRGVSAEKLEAITPMPLADPTFADSVQSGARYVYAVEAIDKAGNISPMSNHAEETAR
jgi:hypothetical protein